MPTPKHGLGRGLDALISKPARPAPAEGGGVQLVELSLIEPNPHQPRHVMQPQELEELAASIREHGVLQPLPGLSAQVRATFTVTSSNNASTAAWPLPSLT